MKKTYVDIVIVVGHSKSRKGAYNKDLKEFEFSNNNRFKYNICFGSSNLKYSFIDDTYHQKAIQYRHEVKFFPAYL